MERLAIIIHNSFRAIGFHASRSPSSPYSPAPQGSQLITLVTALEGEHYAATYNRGIEKYKHLDLVFYYIDNFLTSSSDKTLLAINSVWTSHSQPQLAFLGLAGEVDDLHEAAAELLEHHPLDLALGLASLLALLSLHDRGVQGVISVTCND